MLPGFGNPLRVTLMRFDLPPYFLSTAFHRTYTRLEVCQEAKEVAVIAFCA